MLKGYAWFLFAVAGTAAAEPPPRALSAELHALATEARFGAEVPVIVTFADRPDPRQFRHFAEKRERRHRLITTLRRQSQDRPRRAMAEFLRARGAKALKSLWLTNSVAVTVPAALLAELGNWPGVIDVRPDVVVRAPTTDYGSGTVAGTNIRALRAYEAWGQGYLGQGVTVAILDTGVDASHPDLRQQYRGGGNSWFDPYGEHPAPYDVNGHGTSVAGVALGRNASGNAIGMAPEAQWIAAKIFNDAGLSAASTIHQALQWLLDPDGDPATDDAPDLVNASWGLVGSSTACDHEFEPDVQALRAAGIGVVFSAGNDGPGPGTTVSPGNYSGVLSVAAVDAADEVARFSSRGPSACDSAIDPELAAPGVSVYTADTSFGLGDGRWRYMDGTSFAAPHVTGALALLWSARPTATIDELETALRDTARDLGALGPDSDSGYGVIDAAAALAQVLNGEAPVAGADSATTDEDTPVTIDVLANDRDPHGAPLTLAAVGSPTRHGGSAQRNADGTVRYTPAADFAGTDSFSYTVSNGRVSGIGRVTVTVLPANDAPRASDDAFTLTADPASGQFALPGPGVLANDSDPDGDALGLALVGNVAAGSVQLQPDGGFLYTPPASGAPAGPLRFTYRLSDGVLSSNVATVTFTLNHAPLANDDAFATLAAGLDGRYSVASPGVLANDSDPDGQPIGATLVENVAQGSVQLLATGGFSYTPPDGGAPAGALRFSYQATDGMAASNVASVSFTVNRAPVASDDQYRFTAPDADGSYRVAAPGVLANDVDADGAPLSAALVANVSQGSVTLAPDGGFVYTPPAAGAPHTTLRFTYRASDGGSVGNLASVTITVNRAPVAAGDRFTLGTPNADGSYTIAAPGVLANDTDADGEVPTAVLVDGVRDGSVSLAADGGLRYTPPPGGAPARALEFSYRARDWLETGNVATVRLNRAPVASDDSLVLTDDGSGQHYRSSISVLANDRDPDGDRLTALRAGDTASGTVTLDVNGNFFYTPPSTGVPDGTLQFTYRVSDDITTSDVRGVTFTVYQPVSTGGGGIGGGPIASPTPYPSSGGSAPPVPFESSDPTRTRDAPAEEGTDWSSSTDRTRSESPPAERETARRPEGEEERLAARDDDFLLDGPNEQGQYRIDAPGVLANDRGEGLAAQLVQNVRVGKLTLAANGGFVYTPPAHGMADGALSFTYKLRAAGAVSGEATVTLSLRRPLAARPDRYELATRERNGDYRVAKPGVLANDSGPEGLQAALVQNVTAGRIQLAPDGAFSFTPPPGAMPRVPLSFTYKVVSGKHTSRTATVLFTLRQPLAAQPDHFVLAAVDPQGRYLLPGPGVLANDSGEGALTAVLTQNAAAGTVTLAPSGGFSYRPPAGDAPPQPLSFRYRVQDGRNSSPEATVTFKLAPTAKTSMSMWMSGSGGAGPLPPVPAVSRR